MSEFDGKVALVTGGARGIGYAIAERFVRGGARVAICDLVEDDVTAAAEKLGGGTRGYQANITEPDTIKAMIKAIGADLGPVAILVNNAGITRDTLSMRMKDDQWRAVIETNLTGTFFCCRAVERDMIKQRYGRIVNISSIVGRRGQAGQANYAAAKAGVIGMTKALAHELASRNITVNAVCPGYIETAMTDALPEEVRNAIVERIPMARRGTSEEVANAVAFLASDAASYTTGSILAVDGGMAM